MTVVNTLSFISIYTHTAKYSSVKFGRHFNNIKLEKSHVCTKGHTYVNILKFSN